MTSIPPPGDGVAPEHSQADPQQPPAASALDPPAGGAGWRPWTAPAALLTWFGITIILTIVIAGVSAAMGNSLKDPPPGVNIAGTFFQDLAMIAAALIFAQLAGRARPADFGLRRTPVGRATGLIIAVWVGFFAFSLLWKVAVSLDEPQTLPDELGVEGSTLRLVLVVILITVIAPLCEELLFRGYVFAALRNWKGFLPAAMLTGLIFGAVHIGSSPIGYAVPLACFGFGLCLLYQRTGSLYPCIALHALNNALALGVNQKWGWEIAPTMVGAVVVSVTLASLLGRTLGRRAERAAGPLPLPAA